MSLTNIDSFSRKDCEKIDANCVNAFVDFHINPDAPTELCLDTSWGGNCIDLTDIVRAAQTCTSLYLSPEIDPNCLVYEGECETYCITGDELSRIISMSKLKDVDQGTAPVNGDIYMYNNGKFYTFNLQQYMDNIDTIIRGIQASITNLQNRMTAAENRITNIENTIAPIVSRWEVFEGVLNDAKICSATSTCSLMTRPPSILAVISLA